MDTTSATSAARFLPRSHAKAVQVGPGALRHVPETGSTNTDLADEARAGDGSAAVLVADHQRAGRGRLDRRWVDDSASSLLVSLRVPATVDGAGAAVQALGAAARAAADALCHDRVLAKWPNDLVVIEGSVPGKLAGVLAEFVPGAASCVVIGLGLNIAPISGQAGATSIAECGGPNDRDALLARVLEEFAPRVADPERTRSDLLAASATIGRRVRVEQPGGDTLTGVAEDLAASGQLLVRRDDGTVETVGVGDVVHLRTD